MVFKHYIIEDLLLQEEIEKFSVNAEKIYLIDKNVAKAHERFEPELANIFEMLRDLDKNIKAIEVDNLLLQFTHWLGDQIVNNTQTIAVRCHRYLVRVLGLLLLQVRYL